MYPFSAFLGKGLPLWKPLDRLLTIRLDGKHRRGFILRRTRYRECREDAAWQPRYGRPIAIVRHETIWGCVHEKRKIVDGIGCASRFESGAWGRIGTTPR